MPKPRDAFRSADGLVKDLPEANAHIFDGVVGVNLQIASGVYFDIEDPMAREVREHVIEESDSRRDGAAALAIDVDGHGYTSFFGFSR
jgi:hypothetical protein